MQALQCPAHVGKAHAFLFKAYLLSPEVVAKPLVDHPLVLGQKGKLGPRLFRLPHPEALVQHEGLVVHEEGGAMGKDGAQLVQNGKAVGVEIPPVEDGNLGKPGDKRKERERTLPHSSPN